MITKTDLTGAILAGGQARRMQSLAEDATIDKGLLNLGGAPLVAWQYQQLAPWVDTLIINANQNLEAYRPYGHVVPDDDDLPPAQGPLIGLLSILRHSPTPWVVVIPVDSPFLPSDLIEQLVRAQSRQPERQVFYCRADRDYPLCLLVHVDVAPSLAEYVLADGRRVMPWLEQVAAVAVDFGARASEHFTNINTPQDLERAQTLARRAGE